MNDCRLRGSLVRARPVRLPLVRSRAMLRCAQCGCISEDARAWIAFLRGDPDDERAPTEVVAFCPVCAAREFRVPAKAAETYT